MAAETAAETALRDQTPETIGGSTTAGKVASAVGAARPVAAAAVAATATAAVAATAAAALAAAADLCRSVLPGEQSFCEGDGAIRHPGPPHLEV